MPVEISMHSDALRHANPAWLVRLRWGAGLTLASVIATFALVLLSLFLGGPTSHIYIFAPLVYALLILSGMWILGAAEPGQLKTADSDRKPNKLRIFVVAAVAASLFLRVVGPLLNTHVSAAAAVLVTSLIYPIMYVVGAYLLFSRIVAIANRMPDKTCARVGQVLIFVLPITAFGSIVSNIMALQMSGKSPGALSPPPALSSVLRIATCTTLLAGILFVYLMIRFLRQLKIAHRESRANWKDATSQSQSSDSHIHPA